ncbi:MAG: transposase [Proteobacteria bacterium]|nr:MAG: transposase [Pseudomonadota bacterium]
MVEIFSIELIAYCVMANHVHTVIRNRPDLARTWSAEEVARRWRKLFALRRAKKGAVEPSQEEIEAIANNPERVELYRTRLASISWFNRCMCEFIARRANREDECTGRFWEGRFKSIRIHDVCGLIACGIYVDLNPVRAGEAATPEQCNYTSIQDRIRAIEGSPRHSLNTPSLLSIEEVSVGRLSTLDYIKLVDVTGREIIKNRGKIASEIAPILERLKINPAKWSDTVNHYSIRFRRMVGPSQALRAAAEKIGKRWFHGLSTTRAAFL